MPKLKKITEKEAKAVCEWAEPVKGFSIKFRWHTGPWREIFDRQIELIRSDIARAIAEDKLIVYLSCPISSRGGGYSGTNVDVAKFIERRLLERWGEAFWILNPAQYQLESKAGTGLMDRHAKELGFDLKELRTFSDPNGGDYMRMWTTVLVKNNLQVDPKQIDPCTSNFDAFYFIGPRDVQEFFTTPDTTLTAGVQQYFSRKYSNDPDFRDRFSVPGIVWRPKDPSKGLTPEEQADRDGWERIRIEFLRYYALRASTNFSLGCHDEWLIFKLLNDRRRKLSVTSDYVDGDVGNQIAGFFDGGQIDLASAERGVSRGYAG